MKYRKIYLARGNMNVAIPHTCPGGRRQGDLSCIHKRNMNVAVLCGAIHETP